MPQAPSFVAQSPPYGSRGKERKGLERGQQRLARRLLPFPYHLPTNLLRQISFGISRRSWDLLVW